MSFLSDINLVCSFDIKLWVTRTLMRLHNTSTNSSAGRHSCLRVLRSIDCHVLNITCWTLFCYNNFKMKSENFSVSGHLLHFTYTEWISNNLCSHIIELKYLKFIPSSINLTFWWLVHTQTLCVPDDPARTHHSGRNSANLDDPMGCCGYYFLNIKCKTLT